MVQRIGTFSHLRTGKIRRLEVDLLVDEKAVHSLRGVIGDSEGGDTFVGEEVTADGTKILVNKTMSLIDIYCEAEKMGQKKYGGKHTISIRTLPYP